MSDVVGEIIPIISSTRLPYFLLMCSFAFAAHVLWVLMLVLQHPFPCCAFFYAPQKQGNSHGHNAEK
jgi:hypothetical protein